MARQKKKKTKHNLRPGQCKIINTPAGRRKICKLRNGKVRFRKLSFKPR